MENLFIKATKYTPEISFNANNGIMDIRGKSYPENTFEYYKPVMNWVEEYFKSLKNEKIVFNLELEYLNSSSLKAFFDLLDILEVAHDNGKNIEINWIFDKDNDIAEETGEDFAADFKNLNFTLIPKK